MTNQEIARALLQLADALEVAGGNEAVFRVRALRRGAQAIDALAEPAERLLESGRLLEVPGIGKGIAARVEELVRTGDLAELSALRRAGPHLGELALVDGIGPKTARLLYEKLGIATLDELEAAARAGQLRHLPRMGARREARILAGVARARAGRGRVRLSRAEEEARPLLERLAGLPGVERVELAGSVRRRKDTVADLDFLVAAREPAPVMEAFVGSAGVGAVLGRGDTKASVRLRSGLQADLRVVPPESWGAALHYFTGSKEHNVRIRGLGQKRGLKINEYGIFDASTGARLGGEREQDVFSAVGLPWIPPELREDRGEIEAAAAGRLPRLIELSDLRGDLHMHTTETDGRASLEDMIRAAVELGREYIAITDHSVSLKMVRGLDRERLRAQRRRIRELEASWEGRIRVLAGVEADILADGSVDLGPDTLGELDWVVGSVHSHFQLPRAEQTRRIVRAMESGLIDVLGHPTGRLLESRPPYEVDLEAVVQAAVRTGVALELNAYPERLDLDDVHARAARDAGALLVIDSDAHATTHLAGLRYGVDVARRAWLEPRHVLNAQPLSFLLDHRSRRKGRPFLRG